MLPVVMAKQMKKEETKKNKKKPDRRNFKSRESILQVLSQEFYVVGSGWLSSTRYLLDEKQRWGQKRMGMARGEEVGETPKCPKRDTYTNPEAGIKG